MQVCPVCWQLVTQGRSSDDPETYMGDTYGCVLFWAGGCRVQSYGCGRDLQAGRLGEVGGNLQASRHGVLSLPSSVRLIDVFPDIISIYLAREMAPMRGPRSVVHE
jgi:hypothetical protein